MPRQSLKGECESSREHCAIEDARIGKGQSGRCCRNASLCEPALNELNLHKILEDLYSSFWQKFLVSCLWGRVVGWVRSINNFFENWQIKVTEKIGACVEKQTRRTRSPSLRNMCLKGAGNRVTLNCFPYSRGPPGGPQTHLATESSPAAAPAPSLLNAASAPPQRCLS